VRWLGAKLMAMGYEVWADVMRLHGGIDWARELEGALRQRAAKMVLVCTPSGLEKQGVRNEIEIAVNLARRLAMTPSSSHCVSSHTMRRSASHRSSTSTSRAAGREGSWS
jgi:hypothetical protein